VMGHSNLQMEYYVLLGFRDQITVPRVYTLHTHPKNYTMSNQRSFQIVVVELLDKDLSRLVRERGDKFTESTCKYILTTLMKDLRTMHKRNWSYSDMKPANFMIGFEDRMKLYWVDLGGMTVAGACHSTHIGTGMYSSRSAHLLKGIGNKEDLESLGYMVAELLEGKLPWENAKGLEEAGRIKISCRVDEITSWPVLQSYLSLVRSEDYTVDYEALLNLFEPYLDVIPEWV